MKEARLDLRIDADLKRDIEAYLRRRAPRMRMGDLVEKLFRSLLEYERKSEEERARFFVMGEKESSD